MPRRKRHYVYCKKGLHLLSRWGGVKLTKKKSFQRKQYVTRLCLLCRRTYQRKYYKEHYTTEQRSIRYLKEKGAKKLAPFLN